MLSLLNINLHCQNIAFYIQYRWHRPPEKQTKIKLKKKIIQIYQQIKSTILSQPNAAKTIRELKTLFFVRLPFGFMFIVHARKMRILILFQCEHRHPHTSGHDVAVF